MFGGDCRQVEGASVGLASVGPHQIQAAIAALHNEAPTAEQTDWLQILVLYDVLTRAAPGPIVTLSRAVAVASVHGPAARLAALGTLDVDERIAHPPPRGRPGTPARTG